jgi:cyclophilin family peptidyl-prolyl cis-trans isomerase
MNLCRNTLFAASLLILASAASLAADGPTSKKPSSDPNFQKIYGQWKSVLADLAEIQTKLLTDSKGAPSPLKDQFAKLTKQADEIKPELQSAAEAAYLADDKNKSLADLLFIMALAHLRNDNYEEAQRLAELIIDHHYPEPDVKHAHRIAASAAFASMQLDKAKQHLEAALDDKNTKEADKEPLLELLAATEFYKPIWEQEQKLRAAEEKAADPLPRVKLQTGKGDIVVELFENEAPNTVANFVSLVEKGLYDGTQFHRVLPAFVVQGGDPISKNPQANPSDIGSGGPGYMIECECRKPEARKHFRGSLSMAHSGPNTGGSQFFLTLVPTTHLDGGHTVFGRIVEGIDVLAKIQRAEPGKSPANIIPDKIIKAEVLRKREHPYVPKKIGEGEQPK